MPFCEYFSFKKFGFGVHYIQFVNNIAKLERTLRI